jgi:uncharacterized protein
MPRREPSTSDGWAQRPSPPAAVVETHSAVVVFVGDLAYKLKKPVALDVLDFRSPTARELACRREVDLNRRFAPDVYLGVAVLSGPARDEHEHLVVMRRMPPERRLSTLAAAGEPLDDAIDSIVDQLHAVHASGAPVRPDEATATAEDLRALWTANLDVLDGEVATFGSRAIDRCRELANLYLDRCGAVFDRRITEGCVRDGHGDLLADDIFCLDDGPRILDCLDFDDRLRRGDVLADVAFLAMDLERLGRPDLAGRVLARYRERPGVVPWPASLEHHYVAYRAAVRAKVAVFRARQSSDAEVHAQLALARTYLHLAVEHLRLGQPRLVLIGGSPATGKSTTAGWLEARGDAVRLRSDEIRRSMGLAAEARYSPEAHRAVYAELLRRAEPLLRAGENVVLDATWRRAGDRRAARELADAVGARPLEIRCVCPPWQAERRMRLRALDGTDLSEATPEIAAEIAAHFDGWPEAAELSTARAPGRVLDRLVALQVALAHPTARAHTAV